MEIDTQNYSPESSPCPDTKCDENPTLIINPPLNAQDDPGRVFLELPNGITFIDGWTLMTTPRPPIPEVIEGLLKKKQTLLIAGPAKIGKSKFAMHLAGCLTSGQPFLKLKCLKSKVLYVDFENGQDEDDSRISDIAGPLNLSKPNIQNCVLLDYPIHTSFNYMKNLIIPFATNHNIDVIILDPIGRVVPDENALKDMKDFCEMIDDIKMETNCSVILVHHHSKGALSTTSINRASGHSFLVRAVQSYLDISPTRKRLNSSGESVPAFKISTAARSFAPINNTVLLDDPLFTVAPLKENNSSKSSGSLKQGKDRPALVRAAFDKLTNEDNPTVHIKDLASELGIDQHTARDWIDQTEGFSRGQGLVFKEDGSPASP